MGETLCFLFIFFIRWFIEELQAHSITNDDAREAKAKVYSLAVSTSACWRTSGYVTKLVITLRTD